MANEEKIIAMLEQLQKDVAALKVEFENIKHMEYRKFAGETKEERIARNLAAVEGMRSVLTKEEADKLAEIVGI